MIAGYAPNSKGYKFWDAKLNKLIIPWDVRFDESIPDPQSQVGNESKPSSESTFNIEMDSESDKYDDETTQIEYSEVPVDEDEEQSENDDQTES